MRLIHRQSHASFRIQQDRYHLEGNHLHRGSAWCPNQGLLWKSIVTLSNRTYWTSGHSRREASDLRFRVVVRISHLNSDHESGQLRPIVSLFVLRPSDLWCCVLLSFLTRFRYTLHILSDFNYGPINNLGNSFRCNGEIWKPQRANALNAPANVFVRYFLPPINIDYGLFTSLRKSVANAKFLVVRSYSQWALVFKITDMPDMAFTKMGNFPSI